NQKKSYIHGAGPPNSRANPGAAASSTSPNATASRAERNPVYNDDNVPMEIGRARPASEARSTDTAPPSATTRQGPWFSGNNPSSTDRTNSSDTGGYPRPSRAPTTSSNRSIHRYDQTGRIRCSSTSIASGCAGGPVNLSVCPRPRNPRRYESKDAHPSSEVATRCLQLIAYSNSSGPPGSEPSVNDAYASMPDVPRTTTVRCTSSLNHRPNTRDGHQSPSSESIGPLMARYRRAVAGAHRVQISFGRVLLDRQRSGCAAREVVELDGVARHRSGQLVPH